MTKEDFVLDAQAKPFEYHNRTRAGRVERVTDNFVTLELAFDHENPPKQFKSFRYEKMTKIG